MSQSTATDTSRSNFVSRLSGAMERVRKNPTIALLIAGAASIALITVLLMWAQSPEYRVLYSNLSESDGGSVLAELESRGVPYEFGRGSTTLLVPADKVHSLRLQLAEQGLPKGGAAGFELMEDQAFGISQFAEQINYQRGLEGELARSMESLGPVNRARVHLAMAKDSVFVRKREPAKASVVLSLHSGRLGDGEVTSIVHMVSSSVPGLIAEDVTVIDQTGRMLTQPDSNGLGLDGTQLDYVTKVEKIYQDRIEAILSPILGAGKIKAQVAAEVDFSQREGTTQSYAPNQPPNEAAVRSRQSRVSYQGDDAYVGGVPGALSNTPPGYAPSPIQAPEGDDDEDDAGDGDNITSNKAHLDQDNVVNYELDKSVMHTQYERGKVQRLSAAVVIDYHDVEGDTGEDGEPLDSSSAPLSDERMEQVERLVRQAMGFSEERGDEIAVVNAAFSETEVEQYTLAWWENSTNQQMLFTLGRYLLVAIAIFFIYRLILRPFIRRAVEAPSASEATESASTGTGSTINASVGDDDETQGATVGSATNDSSSDVAAGEDGAGYDNPARTRKQTPQELHMQELRDMATNDPRMVATIVRNWMTPDDNE